MVGLQPRGDLSGELGRISDHLRGRRVRLDGDHLTRPHLIAGDVHPPAIDRPMAMTYELASLPARGREAETHQDGVQPALEQGEEVLAGDAGLPRRLFVIAVELLLEHSV